MNTLKEVTKHIEAIGLEVEVRESRGRLVTIHADGAGQQRFVLRLRTRRGHTRLLRVRDVDNLQRMVLLEVKVREFGTPEAYLMGLDERYFVTGAPSEAESVAYALEKMVPEDVEYARRRGLDVKRQGDWFFIPAGWIENLNRKREEKGIFTQLDSTLSPMGDHIPEEWTMYYSSLYVRGTIKHHEHRTLYLKRWHLAIRNRAVRRQDGLDSKWID